MDTEQLVASQFTLNDDIIYLNHAAVSPWPANTSQAVCDFARQNSEQGSLQYPQWLETETRLRDDIRKLINAPSKDDIALVKNTSEALSLVAYGIDWQPGDNVVITNQEFPSNRIVWESLKNRGVELRVANVSDWDNPSPEQQVIDQCDARTRLVSVSSVQYATGLKMQLATIGEHCHANDILFCVDAIQSVGAVDFDVQKIKADFAMADGHKWMLGPEGLAFFYCAGHVRDALNVTQYGWHMVEDMGNFDAKDWEPARSARRFECGSPNMLCIHALQASVSFILQVGIDYIEARIRQNTQRMLEQIQNHAQLQVLSPTHLEQLAGIITFKRRDKSSAELFQQLKESHVFCAERGGGIRFSPHFYTTPEKIDHAIKVASR
ncbi:MAG: aminotransferase class V-fold PLP-dependent enzyme [Gammaproteobacteria bacterium]|jgi:selenocysteine lyase/cysteine desulfurase